MHDVACEGGSDSIIGSAPPSREETEAKRLRPHELVREAVAAAHSDPDPEFPFRGGDRLASGSFHIAREGTDNAEYFLNQLPATAKWANGRYELPAEGDDLLEFPVPDFMGKQDPMYEVRTADGLLIGCRIKSDIVADSELPASVVFPPDFDNEGDRPCPVDGVCWKDGGNSYGWSVQSGFGGNRLSKFFPVVVVPKELKSKPSKERKRRIADFFEAGGCNDQRLFSYAVYTRASHELFDPVLTLDKRCVKRQSGEMSWTGVEATGDPKYFALANEVSP